MTYDPTNSVMARKPSDTDETWLARWHVRLASCEQMMAQADDELERYTWHRKADEARKRIAQLEIA